MIFPVQHYEEVPCANDEYRIDRIDFKQCAPKHCARFFTDYVITENEADVLLR